jgi:hypothetical protein
MAENSELVPVFIPALAALLLDAEEKKGAPLTENEVLYIRDKGVCMMLEPDRAALLERKRGYHDIDPENCWIEWQAMRRELGRA